MKYSFYSDSERIKSLISDIKNRSIATKHSYVNGGAQDFYNAKEIQLESNDWAPHYFQFLKENILKNIRNKKIAFISLGCGKDDMGKEVLTKLYEEGYNIDYYGIDVSEQMLEMHKECFKDTPFLVTQMLADFSDYDFKRNLDEVLQGEYDFKIFAFFGATIGNIKLTNTADTFQNILDTGDYLWNDCVVQEDNETTTKINRFNYYLSFFKDPESASFFFNPLKQIGVPFESGKLFLRSESERSVGTLLYTIGFKFEEVVKVSYMKNEIIFLPGEEIELNFIRDYTPEPFIQFFGHHYLESVASWKHKTLGQFLFQRK